MTAFIFTLLRLSLVVATATPAIHESSDPSEAACYDWGEYTLERVSVLEGEASWLSCPLFRHPSLYNYSSSQSAGQNLVWYRLFDGHELEQPITHSVRLSKARERLLLQPAIANDTGQYICMLRNKSHCSKMAVRLTVLRRDEASPGSECDLPVATAASQVVIYLQKGKTINCPDWQEATNMADSPPTVSWYHECQQPNQWTSDREQIGASLEVHYMTDPYQGLYYCQVHYQRGGRALTFTRSVNVTAVYSPSQHEKPSILQPTEDQVFPVKRDSNVRLVCRGYFPYLDSAWEIWWTVNGKTLEELADPRFSRTNHQVNYDFGNRIEESVLLIRDFRSEDLTTTFNCSVRNKQGFETRRAQLEEEVSLPTVELGCGLALTLVLMLVLFVVYHVFWLELLLLYRSWFGTDERDTDDKEFDVYISYARNSDEEKFVLWTLRRVLENELGYTVCIFDRDSLPGGTITDETLSFIARSRRLLVVFGPGYASRGSHALLELKAGIDGIMGGHLRIILVQYKPVQRQDWVQELRMARVVLALVRWQGDKSKELTSRFWKKLRVELPVRRVGLEEEAELMFSQNRTSKHTDLNEAHKVLK
ncbi:interleukin-1 receptor accessory protein [Dunckerocampus dactyliophorus]|uniref:interleukin-1 receptor accessory protein n=1 Tax=Dunckerocampus dactyliophorus TaxID=161453 RepID=UPI0024058143|nr:interleukin-1 receptor accessory protein [Dunckerocampus dactyliophorus]